MRISLTRGALVTAATLALAACGDEPAKPVDPARYASVNMVNQFVLLCPNLDFTWEAFEAAAASLGATADEGEVRRPHGARDAEIVREKWVALDHLGRRTTAWIAELGPGTRYVHGVAGVNHKSGLICAIHDPGLSRQQAFALVKDWEGGEMTGAERTGTGPTDFVVRAKVWVNSTRGSSIYRDVELFTFADNDNDGGAMMIRHFYNYRDTPPAS